LVGYSPARWDTILFLPFSCRGLPFEPTFLQRFLLYLFVSCVETANGVTFKFPSSNLPDECLFSLLCFNSGRAGTCIVYSPLIYAKRNPVASSSHLERYQAHFPLLNNRFDPVPLSSPFSFRIFGGQFPFDLPLFSFHVSFSPPLWHLRPSTPSFFFYECQKASCPPSLIQRISRARPLFLTAAIYATYTSSTPPPRSPHPLFRRLAQSLSPLFSFPLFPHMRYAKIMMS